MTFGERLVKAFTTLTRDGEVAATGGLPRTKYNYASDVGDGLSSSIIVALAMWVMRQAPEARLGVMDKNGDVNFSHPMVQLFRKPNPWYGEGVLRMAVAGDYTINGNAILEIERGKTNRMPVGLLYQPWAQITAKGDEANLITHYEHSVSGVPRIIKVEDAVHFRFGLDPRNMRHGISPLHSLMREVFTDDEAANFTASILRNMGFPGIVITPTDTDAEEIGPDTRRRLRNYFKRMFRGDSRGEVYVSKGGIKLDTIQVDFAKMNIDKLRQIPEERASAVVGIPAAVVGFGTGLEQTTVGATLKELRELAYENAIIPMQRSNAEELEAKLLPEFEPNPGDFTVVYDNSEVRVLQEDQNRLAERAVKLWQGGLFTRAQSLRLLGKEATPADEVLCMLTWNMIVPVGDDVTARYPLPEPSGDDSPKSTKANKTANEPQRALNHKLLQDRAELSLTWAGELVAKFNDMADALSAALADELSVSSSVNMLRGYVTTNGKVSKDATQDERAAVERALLNTKSELEYGPEYIRISKKTVDSINIVFKLGVDFDPQFERRVIMEGGTRKGLIDMSTQTRDSMYSALEQAREEGMGPVDSAKVLKERIARGPWSSVETRAMVIARTETLHAQRIATVETYRKADTVTGVLAFDAQLGDTDADCMARNGKTFTTDEAELINEHRHPQCTLSWAPVIGGF